MLDTNFNNPWVPFARRMVECILQYASCILIYKGDSVEIEAHTSVSEANAIMLSFGHNVFPYGEPRPVQDCIPSFKQKGDNATLTLKAKSFKWEK